METIPRSKEPVAAAALALTVELDALLTRARGALDAPTHLLRSGFVLAQLAANPLGGRRPMDTELDAGWVRDRLRELGALPTAADGEARVFEGLREEIESHTVGVAVPSGVRPPRARAYRYFACAPTNLVAVECGVCGAKAHGYDRLFGERDVDEICERCIQQGELGSRAATINVGDAPALAAAMERHVPGIAKAEARKLARERSLELETRTLRPEHWQSHEWPIHCGDYCAYHGEVGVAELTSLAGEGDPKAFFEQHLAEDEGPCDVESVWPTLRPEAPGPGQGAYDTGVYHYRCLSCSRAVLLWDCN